MAPAGTLLAKKRLIEELTRRLFNHVEHGINVQVLATRRVLASKSDRSERSASSAAMLAGAIFNRAADIFTKLVEIQELGVTIEP